MPLSDESYSLRVLWLATRFPVGAWHAEFPAYVKPLRLVRKLDKDSAALRDGTVDLETGVVGACLPISSVSFIGSGATCGVSPGQSSSGGAAFAAICVGVKPSRWSTRTSTPSRAGWSGSAAT